MTGEPRTEKPPTTPQTVATLSSLQTFYMKIVFPTVWIGIFTAGSLAVLASPNLDPDAAFMRWLFPVSTVAGAVFLWWGCMRLKRVRMDDQALYISNYSREIVVPLRDVEEVTENRWINIHPVTIKFRRETEFGSKVMFMPKVRWFAFWSSHPVVGEIRDAVDRAGGSGGNP